tara:strand:- start:3245 stop:6652 length:3408 start_codon:yes stop_codon:yes gene_type:complete
MTQEESFTRYVCWNDEEIDQIFEIDAGNIDDHILEAVHTHASISLNEEKSITEDDVYNRLIDIDGQQGYKIVPIFGLNGSGKSHLVRRLHQRVKNIDKSLVVYVKRSGLSLKSMVESILDELERDLKNDKIDEITELREQLKNAHEEIPLDKTNRDELVLNNVALELQSISTNPNELEALKNSIEDVDLPEDRIISIIEEYTKKLPMLLRAEAFRKPLVKEGGVVDRFVTSAIKTAENFDPDDPDFDGSGFVFTENDLPNQVDAAALGEEEHLVFQNFDIDPPSKSIVASIISTAFISSSETTFGLKGTTDLGKVFRDVRKVLKSKNFTLYVLIEELSQMQAYASSFLDSFIENPEGELCDIHVAIAVTYGFYDNFANDTFKDRVKNVNDGGQFIYVHTSTSPESNTLSTFAANYLNAVRVGNDLLKSSYPNGIPNKCDDCPHREKCHSAFGQVEGKGLYPFNPTSLRNFYKHVTESREELLNQFNPRAFTRNVLRDVLSGAKDEIISSNFPNKNRTALFTDSPSLDGSRRNRVIQQDSDNSERRIELLRFWSESGEESLDLSSIIHTAFNLPLLDKAGPVEGGGVQQINASVNLTDNKSVKITCELILETTLRLIRHNLTDNREEVLKDPFDQREYFDETVEEGKTYRYEIDTTSKTNDGNLQKFSSSEVTVTDNLPIEKEHPLEEKVSDWVGSDQTLTQSNARDLRTALYNAVIERIDWPNLGIPNPPNRSSENFDERLLEQGIKNSNCLHPFGQSGNRGVLNSASFHLTNTQIAAANNSTTFTKEITAKEHGNEMYLLAKAQRDNGLRSLTTDEGVQLLNFIDSIAAEIQTLLIKNTDTNNSYMKAMLERIALAVLCSGNSDNFEERIDALYLAEQIFGEVSESSQPNTNHNTRDWRDLIAGLNENLDDSIAYVIDHNQTVTSSYVDSRTPRIGRLAIMLEDLATNWTPIERPNPDEVISHKINRLTKTKLDLAIDSELKTYLEQIEALSQLLEMAPSWTELESQLSDLFTKSVHSRLVEGVEVRHVMNAINNLTDDTNRREVNYYVNLNETFDKEANATIGKKLETLSSLKTGNDVEIYSNLQVIDTALTIIQENAEQILPDLGQPENDPSPVQSLISSIDDFIEEMQNEH